MRQLQQPQSSQQGWTQQLATLPALLTARLGFLPLSSKAVPSTPQSSLPGGPANDDRPASGVSTPARQQQGPLRPAGEWPGSRGPELHSNPGGVLWQRQPVPPAAAGVPEQQRLPGAELSSRPSPAEPHSHLAAGSRREQSEPASSSPQQPVSAPRQLEDFWAEPGSSTRLVEPVSTAVTDRQRGSQAQASRPANGAGQHRQRSQTAAARRPPSIPAEQPWQEQLRREHSSGQQRQQARAGKNGQQEHKQRRPGPEHELPGIWENLESMDDEVISGVISAAQRAGMRRRMWDN